MSDPGVRLQLYNLSKKVSALEEILKSMSPTGELSYWAKEKATPVKESPLCDCYRCVGLTT